MKKLSYCFSDQEANALALCAEILNLGQAKFGMVLHIACYRFNTCASNCVCLDRE